MRYKITVIVEPEPSVELLGIKEDLVTHCEKFGDVKSVQVTPMETEQVKFKL
ncbi:MAG: hypothetical protein IJ447_02040 [Clostridia bacterium]|nr:hypothetical protein [Clostridia bacterium]